MKKILTIMFLLCGCFLSLSAQELTDAQIKERINKAATQMKSMQCDIVQTKNLKMLNDKLVSRGKMYYKQSSKLRWEYTSPYTYTFILNDQKVQIKTGNRNDVIDVQQNKVFKEIARIMMNTVVGKCLSDDKDFQVKITTSASEYVATLTPLKKDIKQMFQQIVLHFNKKSSMVNKVELQEKNGDKTEIELINIQTNKAINENLFAVD